MTPEPTQTSVSTTPTNNYAGFLERFLASLIDSVLTGIISFVIGMVGGIMGALVTGMSDNGSQAASLFQGLSSLVAWLLGVAYYIYFTGSRGQTLGKMAMKIKVVKITTKTHPTYLDAFLREVVGKIVSTITLGIGYLWMLWNPQKQTLHDKIAGTVVVKA